jgi:4-oxalocrotonate tautomerase
MPFIDVKVVEGVFNPDQKRAIVEGLTEAIVAIEGENMRSVTWVVLEEVKSGDWAIGGKALSTDDVKAMAAGAPA